ncbi:aspartate aminotransferase family protein [Streptomyces sp. SID3212]|uniref:aminotransferase family protein n=1 Tax=Streptomyces sp. SID3212 TaxID=2690259 RepID=UPI00136850B0|nr:aspartate aminotransferase family protein [Streptomyces sp. SID3212]MYV53460.1 aminotransferase class III-fold pyridoxal phosphate-dependent enzyme [Streptomyces sp. SID3212]
MDATRTTPAPRQHRTAESRPEQARTEEARLEQARVEEARARDRRHVWHTWSPLAADRTALMVSHGAGHRVWDVDGKEYLDAASLNSTCGYARPEVIRAIGEQAARLHHFDLSLAGQEPAGLLAERLASYLPPELSKTLFVNSGSEGFEAALMIASAYWSHLGRPRSRVVGFARGYQGSTLLTRSMSTLPRSRHLLRSPVDATLVELPLLPRELRRPESAPLLLAAFERALYENPEDPPAAVVVEPFLNVGGAIVLPPGFLRGLRELCDATGTLLIVDEVFTAYGRSGRMFASLREDVTPDILVSSKGLSGGYVPIAAVNVQQRVHDTFGEDPVIGGLRYGHTTSGHSVACAAALATLDVVEKDGLVERAERLGGVMLDRLAPLADDEHVVDVRGLGLILVVETASPETAASVVVRAREQGLLLRQAGPSVMAVPPLVIDDEGARAVVDGLAGALADTVA